MGVKHGFGHSLRAVLPRRRLSLALLVVVVATCLAVLLPRLQSDEIEVRDGLTFATGDLAAALSNQLVAEQKLGAQTRILDSFPDAAGTLCRSFARADMAGIACREDGGWHLRVQRDGVDIASNDGRQAESVEGGIAAAARAIGAGPALDAGQERAARARGWKAQ
jgi:hypothetical protein